jgi:hypothetical protein
MANAAAYYDVIAALRHGAERVLPPRDVDRQSAIASRAARDGIGPRCSSIGSGVEDL